MSTFKNFLVLLPTHPLLNSVRNGKLLANHHQITDSKQFYVFWILCTKCRYKLILSFHEVWFQTGWHKYKQLFVYAHSKYNHVWSWIKTASQINHNRRSLQCLYVVLQQLTLYNMPLFCWFPWFINGTEWIPIGLLLLWCYYILSHGNNDHIHSNRSALYRMLSNIIIIKFNQFLM